MKVEEKSYTIVKHAYLLKTGDPAIERYGISESDRLKFDIWIGGRSAIEDVYNIPGQSGLWYRVTLKEGPATGSPFEESVVKIKAKVTYDDEIVYFEEDELTIDLYHYTMPKIILDVIKEMKSGEHAELKTENLQEGKDKLFMYFRDEVSDKLFPVDGVENSTTCSIIINLVDYHTPEAMHGLEMREKLPGVLIHKALATGFFKASASAGDLSQDYLKNAARIYQRMISFFTLNDIYNNINEEDDTTPEWAEWKSELDAIHISSHTNAMICKAKLGKWNEVIQIGEKCIEHDPSENVKAIYWMAHAQRKSHKYEESKALLDKLDEIDPNNQNSKKERELLKRDIQKHANKEKALFSKMFT